MAPDGVVVAYQEPDDTGWVRYVVTVTSNGEEKQWEGGGGSEWAARKGAREMVLHHAAEIFASGTPERSVLLDA